ncbi:MAG: acyltransferase [Thermoanaerobaculia bacterium]
MIDVSRVSHEINDRFRHELSRILERGRRLSRHRQLRVRANHCDMVLTADMPAGAIQPFVDQLPSCYVHITNLGLPSEPDRIHWKRLRYPAALRIANMWLGLFCTILPAGNMKNRLYRMMGMSVGQDVEIAQGAFIDPFCPRLVTIGDGTVIGSLATLFTHIYRGRGRLLIGPVVIGRDCVISGTATVAPGVIHDGVTVLPNTATMPLLRHVKHGVIGLPAEADDVADIVNDLPR